MSEGESVGNQVYSDARPLSVGEARFRVHLRHCPEVGQCRHVGGGGGLGCAHLDELLDQVCAGAVAAVVARETELERGGGDARPAG